jgi:hypothetical protein
VGEDEVALQLGEPRLRNAGLGEQAETGVDAVDGAAGRDDAGDGGGGGVDRVQRGGGERHGRPGPDRAELV